MVGLFKNKHNKITVKDFMVLYKAKIDNKTGNATRYPVYENDRIVCVPYSKIDSYDTERCVRCHLKMPVKDLIDFSDYAKMKYGIDAYLPMNICFLCGVQLLEEAEKEQFKRL